MKEYDYLIVGAGLFGSIFAYEMTKQGCKCLVIDKRKHIGGNCYTETIAGINVHKYGPHIFHTNDKKIWNYVNSFVEFNRYTNTPVAFYRDKLYNLPFNMNTFHQMWGVTRPEEALAKIESQRREIQHKPQNLEEQAIALVGRDIYETLIKGYTEKQWGRPCKALPPFIIKRLPVRFTFDNNYFRDNYQGIPIGGYTKLFEQWLANIEVKLGVDFFENRAYFESLAAKIVYTGPIDRFYNFKFGKLDYRGLIFKSKLLDQANFQGSAIVNYTDGAVPYTRIIEHKHFEFGTQPKTLITEEYPQECKNDGDEPYYPVNDAQNQAVYTKYKTLAEAEKSIIFGGRLAEYKYYDMHQVVGNVLNRLRKMTRPL